VRKNKYVEIVPINVGCLGACTYCKTKHARGHLGSYPVLSLVSCFHFDILFAYGHCPILNRVANLFILTPVLDCTQKKDSYPNFCFLVETFFSECRQWRLRISCRWRFQIGNVAVLIAWYWLKGGQSKDCDCRGCQRDLAQQWGHGCLWYSQSSFLLNFSSVLPKEDTFFSMPVVDLFTKLLRSPELVGGMETIFGE